jgi:hypothetical protein
VKAAAADAARKKPAVLVRSSVPAGMPLKGLNFEKNKQDPVALPDEEYPEWLWGILAKGKEEVGGEGGMGDLFCGFPLCPTLERRWLLTLAPQPNPRNSAASLRNACARNNP